MRKKVLLLCVGLCIFCACAQSDNKAKALAEIARFHENFNHGNFSAMYDIADAEGRANSSLEKFTVEMAAMRKGQGAVLKSEELASEYLYINGRSKTRLLVSVTYERAPLERNSSSPTEMKSPNCQAIASSVPKGQYLRIVPITIFCQRELAMESGVCVSRLTAIGGAAERS
ncbi:MAG TPA: hypothetical protein VGW76_09910 [Pyrinomonadaceae bacterium]|nr:hypothetical protein [Pyrinomonadaceae bacterium]